MAAPIKFERDGSLFFIWRAIDVDTGAAVWNQAANIAASTVKVPKGCHVTAAMQTTAGARTSGKIQLRWGVLDHDGSTFTVVNGSSVITGLELGGAAYAKAESSELFVHFDTVVPFVNVDEGATFVIDFMAIFTPNDSPLSLASIQR